MRMLHSGAMAPAGGVVAAAAVGCTGTHVAMSLHDRRLSQCQVALRRAGMNDAAHAVVRTALQANPTSVD
jgi:uncharacterized OsmC-like protein